MIACNGVVQEDLLGEAIHLRRALATGACGVGGSVLPTAGRAR